MRITTLRSAISRMRQGLRRTKHVVAASVLTGAALPLGMFVGPANAITTNTVTLYPTSDTYITSNSPNSNYGTSSVLYASNTAYRAFYRFDTTQIPGSATINSLTLDLYNVNSHTSGGNDIYTVLGAWNENTLTWNNAPGISLPAKATSATPTSPGTYTHTSLPTSAINAGASTAYAIGYSTSGLQHQLSSRENANQPSLTVNYTTTTSDDTAPSVPGSLTSTALSDTGASLSWSASTDNNALDGYNIYRDGEIIDGVSPSTTTYTDTSATPATSYTYTVRAFDLSGNVSNDSNSVSVRTTWHPTTSDMAVVSVGSTSASVTGYMNPNGLSTTANFAYGTTSSLGSTTSNQNIGSGTTAVQVNGTITGLSPNTTYYFRLQGTNSSGGSYPNPITFTTAP